MLKIAHLLIASKKSLFKAAIITAFIFSYQPGMAQGGLGELFVDESEAALADSRKLVRGYISPLMKGLGLGMANGWYNTAKPHKTFGFDFTVTVNGAFIPDKDAFYNIPELELERVELVSVDKDPRATSAPTVFGPNVDVMYRYTAQGNTSRTFQGPTGMGLEEGTLGNVIPVPMAQIGIGFVKNTDIKIRWVPDIQQDDFKFNYFGVGVMHDVKQHIPGLKDFPFDFSVFAGYTNLDFELDLSTGTSSTEGQKATLNSNALTVQGLISKKLAMITVYGGLGFNNVTSELNVLGEYDVNNDGFVDITDPIRELGVPAGGPRATIGARLKLLVLTLHADYTLQEYNVLSAGVGINVR